MHLASKLAFKVSLIVDCSGSVQFEVGSVLSSISETFRFVRFGRHNTK